MVYIPSHSIHVSTMCRCSVLDGTLEWLVAAYKRVSARACLCGLHHKRPVTEYAVQCELCVYVFMTEGYSVGYSLVCLYAYAVVLVCSI